MISLLMKRSGTYDLLDTFYVYLGSLGGYGFLKIGNFLNANGANKPLKIREICFFAEFALQNIESVK
jgi:hypothetical protein